MKETVYIGGLLATQRNGQANERIESVQGAKPTVVQYASTEESLISLSIGIADSHMLSSRVATTDEALQLVEKMPGALLAHHQKIGPVGLENSACVAGKLIRTVEAMITGEAIDDESIDAAGMKLTVLYEAEKAVKDQGITKPVTLSK